jgi:hypothetical protein
MNLTPQNSDPLIHNSLDDLEVGIGGVAIALVIFAIWGIGWGCLWSAASVDRLPYWGAILGIMWQMFIYTGLFITAHDAMHGAIAPKHPRLNLAIGRLALLIYGLFSYDRLLKAHRQHHHHPASDLDLLVSLLYEALLELAAVYRSSYDISYLPSACRHSRSQLNPVLDLAFIPQFDPTVLFWNISTTSRTRRWLSG